MLLSFLLKTQNIVEHHWFIQSEPLETQLIAVVILAFPHAQDEKMTVMFQRQQPLKICSRKLKSVVL